MNGSENKNGERNKRIKWEKVTTNRGVGVSEDVDENHFGEIIEALLYILTHSSSSPIILRLLHTSTSTMDSTHRH